MPALHANDIERTPRDFAQMVDETPTRFRVDTRIYHDARLFDEEMRRIFHEGWVYVGHESEVARPGDYLTTSIGRQPVIVSRGNDGRLRVFLNACRHRGNALCREGHGHSSDFTCRYHGWVFANDGALIAVPDGDAYTEEFEREKPRLALLEARAAAYRGLIFASLKREGESLEDYLGEVRRYIDLWADLSPAGTVRVARPHAYTLRGNWKIQVENGVDNYHPRFVHQSAFSTFRHYSLGRYTDKKPVGDQHNRTLAFANGHSMLERPGLWSVYDDRQRAWYLDQIKARHGAERAEEIFSIRHIHIFPNVCLMDANIRVIQPVSVDQTNVYSYFTAFDDVPQDINDARLADLQRRLGSIGFVNSDDIEIFGGVQTGIRALDWIIFDRGMKREVAHPNGVREGDGTDETPQRAIYRGWLRAMGAAGEAAAAHRPATVSA